MDPARVGIIERMRLHARRYLADADSLHGIAVSESDGAYLLQLIAFEILLKAVLLANDKTPGKNHRYSALFQMVPPETRDRLLTFATARFGSETDFSDLTALLDTWSSNFVSLRYAYEAYEGKSPAEIARLGETWTKAGADGQKADFKYYPLELAAIGEALDKELVSYNLA